MRSLQFATTHSGYNIHYVPTFDLTACGERRNCDTSKPTCGVPKDTFAVGEAHIFLPSSTAVVSFQPLS
jgi:hypothetical protein